MIHNILCIATGKSGAHPFVHLILRNVCSVSALIFDFENCCKNRVRWTHIISHHPLSCIDVIDMDWKKESWKYNKETTNSPRLSPILDCQFFSWGWFATQPFLISWKQFWPAGESACVNIVVSLTGSIGYIWLAGRIYANPRHLPLYYPPLFAQCTDQSFGI